MTARIPINPTQIADFCRRWQIVEFTLFGSVLRDDFGSDSDVDVLVTYAPGTRRRLADLDAMEAELRELFGRPVDLVERKLVEQSENYIRRKQILKSTETIYVA